MEKLSQEYFSLKEQILAKLELAHSALSNGSRSRSYLRYARQSQQESQISADLISRDDTLAKRDESQESAQDLKKRLHFSSASPYRRSTDKKIKELLQQSPCEIKVNLGSQELQKNPEEIKIEKEQERKEEQATTFTPIPFRLPNSTSQPVLTRGRPLRAIRGVTQPGLSQSNSRSPSALFSQHEVSSISPRDTSATTTILQSNHRVLLNERQRLRQPEHDQIVSQRQQSTISRVEDDREKVLKRMERSIEDLKIKHVAALQCPCYSKRVARLQHVLGSVMLNLFAPFDRTIALSNDKKRVLDTSIKSIANYAKSAGRVLSHFKILREYFRLGKSLPPHFAGQIRKLLSGANTVSQAEIDAEFHTLRSKQFDNAKRRQLQKYQLSFHQLRAVLYACLPFCPVQQRSCHSPCGTDNASKLSTTQKRVSKRDDQSQDRRSVSPQNETEWRTSDIMKVQPVNGRVTTTPKPKGQRKQSELFECFAQRRMTMQEMRRHPIKAFARHFIPQNVQSKIEYQPQSRNQKSKGKQSSFSSVKYTEDEPSDISLLNTLSFQQRSPHTQRVFSTRGKHQRRMSSIARVEYAYELKIFLKEKLKIEVFSQDKPLTLIIQEAFKHRDAWLETARQYLLDLRGDRTSKEEKQRIEWLLQKYGGRDSKAFRLEMLRLEKEIRAEMLVERQKIRLQNRREVMSKELMCIQTHLS